MYLKERIFCASTYVLLGQTYEVTHQILSSPNRFRTTVHSNKIYRKCLGYLPSIYIHICKHKLAPCHEPIMVTVIFVWGVC